MKSASSAGKGHWNDPDLLMNNAVDMGIYRLLTDDEQMTTFSLWCFSKAPLIMNIDLSLNTPYYFKYPYLIALN